MEDRTLILLEILSEVQRACSLWPVWPDNLAEAFLKITEEYGEASSEINDMLQGVAERREALPRLRKELIQTAAMCVRMIENL